MKMWVSTIAVAVLVSAIEVGYAAPSGDTAAQNSQTASPLLVGPVERVNLQEGTAVVLGQNVLTQVPLRIAIGETVAVFGKIRSDGWLIASSVQSEGMYVPGATPIVITSIVQRNELSLGRAIVGGLVVDLTPVMSNGSVQLVVGREVRIAGTQPTSGGLILATSISGTATANSISGGARPSSISGGAKPSSISGGA